MCKINLSDLLIQRLIAPSYTAVLKLMVGLYQGETLTAVLKIPVDNVYHFWLTVHIWCPLQKLVYL